QLAGLGVMRPLASKQQVQDAVKNLLAIDLAKLQVGIPMDPLSRDPFREHHSLLGDWIPDRAPQPSIEAFAAEYDAYCLNPTEGALRSLQAAMEKGAKPKNGIEQLSLFKALSLLEYQHVLRTGKRPATIPAQPGPLCSPIWAVGNFAREQAESIGGDIGLTDGDYQAMGIGKNRNTGLGDSSAGWMWLGWVADPSLQHVSLDKLARNGNYFTQTLYEQGPYPIHAAFVVMRRILSEREERTVFQPDYGALVNQGALKLFEPKSPASRALFKSLLANLLTISAHLVLEDAAQRREIDNPAGALQQMRALREYVPTKDSTVGRAMTYLLPLAKKQQGD
ncbi:MAG: hypothetical protein ACAH95_11025, partial [Fimbriimonas sp.]